MYVIVNAACHTPPPEVLIEESQGDIVLHLLASLGYDPLNPPIADFLKRQCALKGDWLVLTPIRWEATHNDAMIVAAGKQLQLSESESRYWFDLFRDYVAEVGSQLFFYDANTWLLSTNDKPAIHAKPPHLLINHSLMPELACLDATTYWQSFFTETQMFFAASTKESVINGLWAWGGAELSLESKLKIAADEDHISLATASMAEVVAYSPELKLNEIDILLINDINILSTNHQQQLNKLSARWYWNNVVYSSTRRGWFHRIWRSITHAY